ncbi:hypothetical protein LCIT_17190 [Leuconostoc citreum]|uniref:Single-stranded DNA-binding protein n=1 Tax=Leuconostoc citreum TaxID=33964 RepID=A0A5A5U0J9_LEUCI|nr:hypothetical protein [Leuconostoc citreum]GDZ84477.1 hypothetical protein LCIT_17190 [Leuconostoc citreum]
MRKYDIEFKMSGIVSSGKQAPKGYFISVETGSYGTFYNQLVKIPTKYLKTLENKLEGYIDNRTHVIITGHMTKDMRDKGRYTYLCEDIKPFSNLERDTNTE